MRISLVLVALVNILPATGHAVIRDVPSPAYPTIQAAVDSCVSGDIVEVGSGYYHETVRIVAKEIRLRTAAGATVQVDRFEWSNPEARGDNGGQINGFEILDGILGIECRQLIVLENCTVHGAVDIGGRGYSGILQACTFNADVWVDDYEFWSFTDVTVHDCVFDNGSLDLSMRSARVTSSEFTNGGIAATNGYIVNNIIANGYIRARGIDRSTSIYDNVLDGGSLGIQVTSFKSDVDIDGNELRNGGGIQVSGPLGYSTQVHNNVLCNCSSGIEVTDHLLASVRNNTVTRCAGRGFNFPYAQLIDFAHNVSSDNQIGVSVTFDEPRPRTFSCNDVWNNPGGNWVGMTDPTGTDDSISEDPEFCSPADCDLTLRVDSPCLPGASPCGLLIGALDEGDCTPTATQPSTWGAVKSRYR